MNEHILDYCQRSVGIIDPRETRPVTIIGCGSIGSFAAVAMAKMGFHRFHLWDDDIVSDLNIGCQNFSFDHIGIPKVDALKQVLIDNAPVDGEDIYTYCKRFTASDTILPMITIVGVDSMEARHSIWKSVKNRSPFLIDGRIGGQLIRVFSIRTKDYLHQEYYEKYLYTDDEAEDLPCTTRNVADVGFFVGAMVARAARMYITDNEVIPESILDARNFITMNSGTMDTADIEELVCA